MAKRKTSTIVHEPAAEYLTKRTLKRAIAKKVRNLSKDAMDRMGYIVTIKNGWIVKKYKHGRIQRIAKLKRSKSSSQRIALD